jgi:hypothetical protein
VTVTGRARRSRRRCAVTWVTPVGRYRGKSPRLP